MHNVPVEVNQLQEDPVGELCERSAKYFNHMFYILREQASHWEPRPYQANNLTS